MHIARALLDRIVAHARREFPNECCGFVATRDGVATEVARVENVAASPFRFDIEPHVLLRTVTAIEDRGDDVGAIYHSHTRSAPYPSQTDANFAAHWPGTEWLIVGLAGEEPEVRHWRIEDGRIAEAELVVDG
jgi:proteasome lid subunit RPN8/RPN11